MTVYLDVIWLLNLLFDSFLLYLTALILKRKVRLYRIILGGMTGSIIIVLSITPLGFLAGSPIIKLIISIAMILVTFGYWRFRYFLRTLLTLYFSTFLIGGILIGVHYFLASDVPFISSKMLSSVSGFGDPISWVFVLLGFPLAWHFSKQKLDDLEMAKIQFSQIVQVKISLLGTVLDLKGLIDSGNQLYDPISKKPVMIATLYGYHGEVPAFLLQLAQNQEKLIAGTLDVPEEVGNSMRMIPCRVIGQEHQLIVAVKPEEINIEKDGENFKTKQGLVSFTMQPLSADGAFHCIVHPKMLTGVKSSDWPMKVG